MANPIDRGDFGIVFYASTDSPEPTYTDVMGQERTAIALSGSLQKMTTSIESAYFHVGGVARYTLQVDIEVDGSSVELGLLGHFNADPTAAFGELATYRNDDQSTKSLHTFTAAGRYILQTANLGAIVEDCLQARLASGSNASVIVRLRVER